MGDWNFMKIVGPKNTKFGIESHPNIWEHLDPKQNLFEQNQFTKLRENFVNHLNLLVKDNKS